MYLNCQCNQDLHIHTIFSQSDSAVVKEQTPELIASIKHAKIIGISDHFEHMYYNDTLTEYLHILEKYNFRKGIEIDGHEYVEEAIKFDFEYFIYHCWDISEDYEALNILLKTGKPVIIAHPYATGTNLNKVPDKCLIEINNRYIYRYDWKNFFSPYLEKFQFILSSDAHQPNWLNQTVAKYVARELNIKETLLF